MATITIADAVSIFTKMADAGRTVIVSFETETTPDNIYTGLGGSRKECDKMSVLQGVTPSDFRKVTRLTGIVSAKSYIETLRALAGKELDKLKTELQLSVEDIDIQLKIGELIESRKAVNESVEAKSRKNGTTVNGMIGLSAKDESPMIRVYCRTNNKPHTDYFLKGVSVDIKSSPWKDYINTNKKKTVSSTCLELGLTQEPFPMRDYRLENVRKFTVDGVTYEIK